MTRRGSSAEFRRRSARIWDSILSHPFVKGIGAGDLARDRFEFYLKQDYAYLADFARVLALSAAKSDALPEMGFLARLLHTTLEIEMDLHRKTCADFGIAAAELVSVERSLITTAYSDFLVRTCYEGSLTDTLAALVPCEAGYAEIAASLKNRGASPSGHYRLWIDTYSSAEFRELAEWVAGRLDERSAGASPEDLARWYRLYVTSARFELLFFDMAWKKELWPRPSPDEP
jgi:thiaminase/transcriptional activator TenA